MDSNELKNTSCAWPRVRIGDVAEVFDGPHATPTKTTVGPVFLGISVLHRGRLDLSNTEHLSEEDFLKWTRRVTPKAGDVVFSYETRIGEAAILPDGLRCCLGRRMGLVRTDKSKLDPHFFLYQYLSPAFQDFLISRTIHGSTVDRIALKDFPDFEIDLPALDIQRQVAKVMLDIDAKIDLNRRINQTLEAMAQAIFKSWFVDFDPVKAKIAAIAEGRDPLRAAMSAISGKPDAELDTLSPEQYEQLAATAALFPQEMEESELGEIPRGWEVGKLEDLLVLQRGFDLPSASRKPGPYPIIAASGPAGTHSMSMAQGPGVITGRSGVLGKVFLELSDFWPLNTTLWVKEFRAATPCYAYEALNLLDFASFNAGSAVPTLNRNHIHSLPHLIPNKDCVAAYERFVTTLHWQVQSNQEQSEILTRTRDTLLPKLLSGELSVTETKEQVTS